ncbi:DoxX family protein [bacterium]|nr:DoxX family protein [bacterium]
MNDLKLLFTQVRPGLLSMMRIVAAFLFMAHGSAKLFGMPAAQPTDPVSWLSQMGVAGMLEFFGGSLLMLGLFTRPVAFTLSGLMAAAYFMSHAPQGFWPLLNRGELAALYCFVFLYLAAAGAGPWSLDHWRRRANRNTATGDQVPTKDYFPEAASRNGGRVHTHVE